MSFLQRIGACDEHDDCTLITCVTNDDIDGYDAGAMVWHSHMHSDVHAEHRINHDHPAVGADGSAVGQTPWCDDCLAHPAVPSVMRGGA